MTDSVPGSSSPGSSSPEPPSPVLLSSGLPETVLPDPPPDLLEALRRALGSKADPRAEVSALVGANPGFLQGWAALASVARDAVEAYAYARVGYHRGLDALRASGWRGSGLVRWEHPSNLGFLESLDALRRAAGQIGEESERQRCELFLRQLDPAWRPGSSGS